MARIAQYELVFRTQTAVQEGHSGASRVDLARRGPAIIVTQVRSMASGLLGAIQQPNLYLKGRENGPGHLRARIAAPHCIVMTQACLFALLAWLHYSLETVPGAAPEHPSAVAVVTPSIAEGKGAQNLLANELPRVRYYGLLANKSRATLARCRQLLAGPPKPSR